MQGQPLEVSSVVGWFAGFHIEGWDGSSNWDGICWWAGQEYYFTCFDCKGWLHKFEAAQ